MQKYEDILTAEKGEFRSLVFDFAQLNNVGEYFEAYGIPATERPVVYAYSGAFFSFRLEGNGTIITDEAIYFHPSHKDWGKENRLPLSDICSYMVFQENAGDDVHLISEKEERLIFGRTVAPRDTTGKELVGLLQGLQRELVAADRGVRHTFERTIGWMLGRITANFKENGILSDRYGQLLTLIGTYPFFTAEVCYAQAKNLYRLSDEAGYYRYIEGLHDVVSEDLLAKLRRPEEEFYESYIEDISNSSAFYMTQSLIPSYINLKKKERLSRRECMLLCFLCIRLDDREFYDALLALISQDMTTKEFWLLCGFSAKYKNEKMADVYEKLLSKVPLTKTQLELTDALGLTPLHYAMILRDEELVRTCLDAGSWYDYKSPFLHDKLVDTVYDPVFLAASLFDNADLIEEVMTKTDLGAKSLMRAKKQLDNFIDINRNLMVKEAGKGAGREEIDSYAKRIVEYEAMRDEIREEIRTMTQTRIEQSRKKAEIVIKTRHPFTRYILYMYLAPDAVYRSIADTISSWRIYRYKQVFFVTSLDHELNLSYFEWQDGEVTDSRILESDVAVSDGTGGAKSHADGDYYENPDFTKRRSEERKREEERRREAERRKSRASGSYAGEEELPPLYEDSWFSPEAHRELSVLKKEYRALVKKYHPDASGEKDAAIMLLIMNERADILERFGMQRG